MTRNEVIICFILSICIHFFIIRNTPNFLKLTQHQKDKEENVLIVETIPKAKITFTNQKVNEELPDKADFLAAQNNRTQQEVKNKIDLKPVPLKNPNISPDIKLPDEGDVEKRSAQRNEQVELPSLEEYLENFRDNNMPEDKYVDINTRAFKSISYFKRLVDKVDLVNSYPYEAAVRGITGTGTVGFILKENGAIEDVVLLETTGSRILDRAMLNIFKKIKYHEPLPKRLGLAELPLKFRCAYRLANQMTWH